MTPWLHPPWVEYFPALENVYNYQLPIAKGPFAALSNEVRAMSRVGRAIDHNAQLALYVLYEEFRRSLLSTSTIETMAHLAQKPRIDFWRGCPSWVFSSLSIALPDYIELTSALDGDEQEKRKNLLERQNCYRR